MTKIRKAVFPVGGLGTRFLPATKAMPKEMLPVVDKPLIQYAVEEAKAAGIEEFIFVTGRGKTLIEDHFDHSFELEETLRARGKAIDYLENDRLIMTPGSIAYTRQQQPLGLGHAVWCARHLIGDEPFAVLLADDFIHSEAPCLKQMTDAYKGGIMVATMEVPSAQVSRYGIVDVESQSGKSLTVRGVVEKPTPETAPSRHAIIGRYILHPGVMTHLEKHQRGAGGEIQLTDALSHCIGVMPFVAYAFEGQRFDCGSTEGLLAASVTVAMTRPALRDNFLREVGPSFQYEQGVSA